MNALAVHFDEPHLARKLESMSDNDCDELDFGVIGIDEEGLVRVFNKYEAELAALRPSSVIGHALFTRVAPCMNNYMVAQRFDDAQDSEEALDITIDYVLR